MNKKAGLNLALYTIGIVLFVIVIVGFYKIPNQTSGFWSFYNYESPTNNLSLLDKSSELNSLSANLSCDVTGIDGDNRDCQSQTSLSQSVNILDGLLKQAGGAVITVYNSFGMTKTLLSYSATYLGIPPAIIGLLTTIVLILLIFAIMYIIFGRSDVS